MKVGEIWERVRYDPMLLPRARIVKLYTFMNLERVEIEQEGDITSEGLWWFDFPRDGFVRDYRKAY